MQDTNRKLRPIEQEVEAQGSGSALRLRAPSAVTEVVLVVVLLQLLSLVALVLEELVHICTSCFGLYTFEFVSCSALLFTLLLLVLLATPLHNSVGISRWPVVVSLVVTLCPLP